MKQCPRCNRTYTDDTLSYCLQDGAVLIRGYDPEATQVNPLPPASEPPPTVAYAAPPPTAPANIPPAPTPPAPTPSPRQKSRLAVGAMVLAALVIGLSIGGFVVQRYSSPSLTEPSTSPTPRSMTATTAATPLPVSATPTPALMATPSPGIVQSTPKPEPDCVLYNYTSGTSAVRVRMNCDTQDCDTDASTIVGEYPNNTPVHVIKGTSVRGVQFTWVRVVITSSGQTVWVAESKIKCG
ncbi:MAG TPA: hypothetical protein VGC66_11540 [Pyrinomonadaceae bacterium]|jgi:hypothetical protein